MKMKRILSSLLAAFLAIGIVSMNVAASDASVSSADELTNAISNASSGDTITLTSDITISSVITITTDITLDLNGYTLTLNASQTRLINISTTGALTVKDSGTNGTITNVAGSYGFFDVYGLLTIESGTFTDIGSNNGATIKGRVNSNVTINGGTFTSSYNASGGSTVNYNVCVDGGGLTINDGTFTVNGSSSSMAGFCVYAGTGTSGSTTYTAQVSITGGTYTTTGYCYGAIKLSCCTGTSESGEVSISNITINTEYSAGIEFEATDATLSDSTITVLYSNSFYSSAIAIDNQSEVTIESGTYDAPYAVYIWSSGGTAIIEGGTYTGSIAVLKADEDTYNNEDGTQTNCEGSVIIVYDGTFDGEISIASTTKDEYGEAELTIYHGEFTDEDASDYVVTASYMDEDGNEVTTYVVSETDDEGNTVTYVHALVLIEAEDATCTENGNIEYYYCTYDSCESPYFVYDEETETYTSVSEDEVIVKALGHYYDVTSEVWSDDYTTLTVTWTCSVCGDTYPLTTTNITSEENEDGTITYKADVEGPYGDAFEFTTSVEGASSDTTDTTDSVDTGDASHVYAWLWTMLAAGFVLIGKGVYTIKRNR